MEYEDRPNQHNNSHKLCDEKDHLLLSLKEVSGNWEKEMTKILDAENATAEEILGLGKGNLIFCCTGSRENYFGSVGQQNNNNLKFEVWDI